MPITIIKGPPNSGRTELVRERFEARLPDEPVLVVPSTDDIFGWERRLTRDRGAFLGGKVVHFKDLVDEILGDESSAREFGGKSRVASPLRRRAIVADAIHAKWPAIAVNLRDQPGLIDAALRSIDEFRENLIVASVFDDPEIREEVGPLAEVYLAYLESLAANDLTDVPARAALASTRRLDEWQGRPVFVAGFDDLTKRQLELIRRLAEVTDVTIAMTHERGNQAMAVTEGLLGELLDLGATVERETRRPETPPDHEPLLVELERSFLDPARDGTLKPGEAITLIEASGRRGEAEAIGAEIARLVDSGVDPGEIAVAIDAPAISGGAICEVLNEYEIPVTLEAETTAPETAVGQAVMNLLEAGSPNGDIAVFFALLRGPLDLDQAEVDRIEFEAVRSGADQVSDAENLAGNLVIPGWEELKAGDPGAAAREVANRAALTLIQVSSESLPNSSTAVETQMATAINQAVEELDRFSEEAVTADQILDAMTSGAVKTWAVPTAHTVQVSSPYSMRAKRAGYVFVASLQEKDLGPGEGSPLMSRQARDLLEMPDLTDQELQETYLFYSCLAVPTEALWLSRRVADVHGKAEFPSAMIAEVTRLFEDGGAGLRTIRRSSSDILFPPDEAPSVHEWTLAGASGMVPASTEPVLLAAVDRIENARRIENETHEFRNMDSPAAKASLAERDVFSATALESFIECPYKWFFERAMSPVRFGPDPAPLARGNLIHDVLAALYKAHPGEIPTPDDVGSWITEMEALVESLAPDAGLGKQTADHQIQRRQVTVELTRFLRRESTRTGTAFKPIDFEQRFGFQEEGSKPAFEGDGWKLRGIIDRVDRDDDGNGVVLDYKSGASSYRTMAEIKREGKVQLLLYLKLLEQQWGLKPAAGLYVPIFAAKKTARGLVDKDLSASLRDFGLVHYDYTEELAEEIEAGIQLAGDAAGKILRGEIAHDPATCLNHFAHAGVPDWIADSGPDGGGE